MKKKYDYQAYDDGILHMEKKSSNTRGIIIAILIVFVLLGGSVFYFYHNGVSFDFHLPWKTEEKASNGSNKNQGKESTKNKNEYDEIEFDSKLLGSDNDYKITFSNFHKTNLGYDFDITFEVKSEPYSIYLEKVLVDGFDTTSSFSKDLNAYEGITQTIRINQSELDALDMISFSKLTLYIKCVNAKGEGEVENYEFYSNAIKTADNTRKGLIEIDKKNQTTVNYYQVLEDKDNTYLYFDFKNNSSVRNQIVSVKKLTINGELYEYKNLKEEVYHGSEKIITLSIPKNKFKKINNFTISFIMLNEENGKKTAAYITNEYSRSI